MGRVKSLASPPDRSTGPLDPILLGTLAGIVSAVGYAAAAIFLRAVALSSDPVWVSCVKAFPTTVIAWLILLARARQGRAVWPRGRQLGHLILMGVFVQLAGNVAFQWALGEVGLALVVPLSFGVLIASGAVMGRVWLHEPITVRSAVAIIVLIAAITVLGMAAGRASESVVPERSTVATWAAVLGVAATGLSGLAYAANTVLIRRTVTGTLPVASTVLVIGTTGVVVLGLLSLGRIGTAGILGTSTADWTYMLLAGGFNALAFFALGKSLQWISVVYSNALNATQIAMTAVAGVLWFQEALTPQLAIGIVLTIAGLLLFRGREEPRLQEAPAATEIEVPRPAGPSRE